MAQVWSTFLRLFGGDAAGEQSARLQDRASLGPSTRPGILEQVSESIGPHMGTLKVGFVGDTYWSDPFVRCTISTPDNGILISNVDVPLVLAVPMPVNIRVFPVGAVPVGVLIELVASASLETDSACDWGPTRTDSVPGAWVAGPANAVLLEPWCQAVTVHAVGATATWLDAAFVALGTFEGYRARPRQAVAVGPSAATLITQHYSS